MILTKYFEKTVEDTRDIPALKSKMNYIYNLQRLSRTPTNICDGTPCSN